MIGQLDMAGLVDIGFALFVTGVCLRSLFKESDTGDKRRANWKAELKELEGTLRELIAEAGAASSNLDRSLLQRKRELETLLKKIEEKQKSSAVSPNGQAYTLGKDDDLPNDSWRKRRPANTAHPASQENVRASDVQDEEWQSGYFELEDLVNGASDKLSLTSRAVSERQTGPQKKTPPLQPAAALAGQVEKIALNETESETFNMTSIMDPTTYKIARRLLSAGLELHVVARKLDLPVSEIRLLDRLMRREEPRQEGGDESMAGTEETRGVIQSARLDSAIEREMALL